MTPRPWWRTRDVARATGLDTRTVRYLAESGRVDVTGWPGEPGTHRMWTLDSLQQLERLGIIVHYTLLDDTSAISAISAGNDEDAPEGEY